MIMQENRKPGHYAEADQYETNKRQAVFFIFEQIHTVFMRNRLSSGTANTEPLSMTALDVTKLFWIHQ